MSKRKFKTGDFVSGKKVSGEPFVGIYVHPYDCGDHLVDCGTGNFCISKNDCQEASEDEVEKIKETIIKPRKELEKETA